MIRIKRRGKIWWMEIHHSGERLRFSLKTRDREIADELRRMKELEILSGGRLGRKNWQALRDEFLGWIEPHVRPSTLRGYRYVIGHFSAFAEHERVVKLEDITHNLISRYCLARGRQAHPWSKKPISPGGIKFDLRVLRRIFSYAMRCRYLQANPVSGFGNLAAEAGRTQPFASEHITRMMDAARPDKRMTAILNVFLHTGLRLGDVIALEKKSVAGERWEVKTRKRSRWVSPLVHPELRRAIDDWQASQNEAQMASEFLFSTDGGEPMRYMDRALRRLWKRAGVSGGHAHRFRDTFATRALELGWTLEDVARALGIGEGVAAKHYAPYTPRQQQRLDEMVRSLDFNSQRKLPIQ